MNIIDLDDSTKSLYCVCLEDWSEEMKEAGNHKACWIEKTKTRGLRVKLAVDDNGNIGGMIQYLPIEHSFIECQDLFFIYCIWVHGYKKGRGDFRNQGMGGVLINAAENDAKILGAKGIAAWGIPLPFWMKASWFKKYGYKKSDQLGFLGPVLLWKPFCETAKKPMWIRPKKKPERKAGVVTVTAFINGWCPAQNIVYERAKRAACEFGDKVVFQGIDTFNKNILLEWGISDGLFVDGKSIRTGPPPSYENIRKIIYKRLKMIK